MSKMSKKVAYLKGLAEGLNVSGENGKLMMAMIETMEALAEELEEMQESLQETMERHDRVRVPALRHGGLL